MNNLYLQMVLLANCNSRNSYHVQSKISVISIFSVTKKLSLPHDISWFGLVKFMIHEYFINIFITVKPICSLMYIETIFYLIHHITIISFNFQLYYFSKIYLYRFRRFIYQHRELQIFKVILILRSVKLLKSLLFFVRYCNMFNWIFCLLLTLNSDWNQLGWILN